MGIPMTRQGYLNLQKQIDDKRAQVPVAQKAISEAREKGDLRENAEYHAAREHFGMLQAQINELESRVAQANIVNTPDSSKGEVALGAKVRVRDLKYGDDELYAIVGLGETDPLKNRILPTSPMGQAMLNKKIGQRFVVEAPGGRLEYEILEINYDE